MASDFIWGEYVDDDGGIWALRVNATYFGHSERGWSPDDGTGHPPFPRQWKPRVVLGVDIEGHGQRAISPTTASLIWTGDSSSFSVLGNDGSTILCTVVGRLGEVTSSRPPGG